MNYKKHSKKSLKRTNSSCQKKEPGKQDTGLRSSLSEGGVKAKCQFHQWRPLTDEGIAAVVAMFGNEIMDRKDFPGFGGEREICSRCGKTRKAKVSLAKPKKRIPPKSQKKISRDTIYKAGLEALPERVRCANCHIYELKTDLSPHHPYGRLGANLYKVVMLHEVEVCGKHHNVHDEPEQATEDGWLQPEFHGLPPIPDKDRVIPWEKQDEVTFACGDEKR